MATTNAAAVGLSHPTVVPTNFEPERESEPSSATGGDDDRTSGRDEQ